VVLKACGDEEGLHPGLNYRFTILYGVGEIANSVKTAIFGLYTLFFATTVLGLPGVWIGIVGFIALVWDAIVDPFIGYLSDRAGFRFGRRHSFMLAGSLVMGISFWAFFSAPQQLSVPVLFIWLLLTSLVVRTANSMFSIPYYALGAELAEDYHERTSITAIRGGMSMLGSLVASSMSFVVFFPDRVPGVDPKLNPEGYASMGLTFGLAMTVAGFVATFGTLALRPSLPTAVASPLRQSLRDFCACTTQSLRNPSFRVLFASATLFFLGVVMNSSLLLHYMTHYAVITESVSLSSLQLVFSLGGLVGVGCWLSVSKNFDKHWLYFFAALMTAALMIAATFLVGEGHLFGTDNVLPMLLGYGLSGFFISVQGFIPQSMLADIADESQLATGLRQEGSFFGIFSFGQQLATGLAILLAGGLIQGYAGLIPGEVHQSALTGQRIGILFGVVPAILVVAAAMVILRYRLTRARIIKIQAALRSAGSATLVN
jgi:glycoside/pentoside/hexuronide:cation symporter, GPH family